MAWSNVNEALREKIVLFCLVFHKNNIEEHVMLLNKVMLSL